MKFFTIKILIQQACSKSAQAYLQDKVDLSLRQSYCFPASASLYSSWWPSARDQSLWFNFRRVPPMTDRNSKLSCARFFRQGTYFGKLGQFGEVFERLQAANVEADHFELRELLQVRLVLVWQPLDCRLVQNQIVKLHQAYTGLDRLITRKDEKENWVLTQGRQWWVQREKCLWFADKFSVGSSAYVSVFSRQ